MGEILELNKLKFNLWTLWKELDEVKLRELLNFLESVDLSYSQNEILYEEDLKNLIEKNKVNIKDVLKLIFSVK